MYIYSNSTVFYFYFSYFEILQRAGYLNDTRTRRKECSKYKYQQYYYPLHFHIFLIEYGLNQELTTADIKNIKKEFTPRPSKKIHSEFLIRYLLSLHTIQNVTFKTLEQESGISENTLKYHSNKKSKTVDYAKPMVNTTASKGKLLTQEQKMIKAMQRYNQLNEENANLWLPYIEEF